MSEISCISNDFDGIKTGLIVMAAQKLTAIAEMFQAYHGALESVEARIDDAFDNAVTKIADHNGTVIVCGMGKSGLVGRKISGTLSSTGTPSVFLHPAEAMHGDLGIVRDKDIIIMISHSGETEEVVHLLPAFKRRNATLIALVGRPSSSLGRAADIVLNAAVDKEACPLNLAPTTSTLTALVIGDAIAIALMDKRGFRAEDFAATHPGGKLGKKLLTRVSDHMQKDNLPFVNADALMSDVIIAMTEGKMGLALIGRPDALKGIVTDGDLRRMLVKGMDLSRSKARDVMSPTPLTIRPDVSFGNAEDKMMEARVQCLVVMDEAQIVRGVIQIY